MGAVKKIYDLGKDQLRKVKNSLESSKWPKRPQAINIEVTAACDAACIHCPREDMDRKMRPMDLDLFKRLIDQAAELEVPSICPNGFGEAMTLRNLEDYLSYIRSKDHRFYIELNSNANRMTKEKRDLLLHYEVDFINICLDGATHQTMSRVRPKLSPEKIEENVISLLNEREKKGLKLPVVRLGYIVIPQNEHEAPAFIRKWKGIADIVNLDGYSNRLDSLEDNFASTNNVVPIKKNTPCVLPFSVLNVWADGKCVLCCNDWNSECIVGDFNTQSLTEIWKGHELAYIRQAHKDGCGNKVDICSRCNWWQHPSPGHKLFK